MNVIPKRKNGGYVNEEDACDHRGYCTGCKAWFCMNDDLFCCINCLGGRFCGTCYRLML